MERWHVGPWTTRGTAVGAPFAPGQKRTPDELNFDVVGLSRILGRRLSGAEELQVRLWQNELRPTHTRQCGVQTLTDPEPLRAAAAEAFAWLAERAPAGYEFVRTDAVELRPLLELDAEVVAVDAVVQLAGAAVTRSVARLATAHVHHSYPGWYAGDAVCNWSGPHESAEAAVAVVTAARAELVEQLRSAGRDELAATAPRWPAVPVS
nr:hypothetical protein [Kribbella sandramycini]